MLLSRQCADVLMIRVIALYSRCKQLLDTFAASVIDHAAAIHLANALKMLLGLEAIIKLVLLIYGTIAQGSELPIKQNKPKLDNSAQSLSPALSQRVLLYAEKRIRFLPRC